MGKNAGVLYAKDLKPCENMVLVKIVKVEGKQKTKSGIILASGSPAAMSAPSANSQENYAFIVEKVGEKVDLKDKSWKVGDYVIINQYDAAEIPVYNEENIYEPTTYFLTKDTSIFATYKPVVEK